MDETSAVIGELRAEVNNLKERVSELAGKVDELLAVMNASKGSIRALAALFGVAATLGAGAATVISWFWFKS